MNAIAKRVVNGYPLTERNSHTYETQGVTFVKQSFWHAVSEDGQRTQAYFTLTDVVTVAAANGWIFPVDTCNWCSGHGWLRVPQTFDLIVCGQCESTGLHPQQPLAVL